MFNCAFIVLGNVSEVSILAGIYLSKNVAVLPVGYRSVLCFVSPAGRLMRRKRFFEHSCILVSLHSLQVLVLVPTRELATQVAKDFKHLTRKLSVACFYGGTPYREQRK